MPNFIITNVCNLSCPFCFASEHMDGEKSGTSARMTVEEFERQLSFIGDQVVRFCGGEPTLHPQFIDMLTMALKRPAGHAYVMTNGVWPAAVREHIARLPRREKNRIGYLFNVLSSEHYRPEQEQQLWQTLQVVSREYATLGVTLYDKHYDYSHVLTLAERFDFRRIRYSAASPNVSDPRSWLVDPARDWPALAQTVHALTMAARKRGIYIHSDCGYLPPCMFTKAQLDDLATEGAFSCNGPIDIGPDGEAWRCYGLYSTMRVKTADFKNSYALGEYFETRTRETKFTPLFDACDTCGLREPYKCAGGCYALRSVKGMQDALVQIGEDPALMRAVPRVRDRVHVGRYEGKLVVMRQEDDASWSKLLLSPREEEIVLLCDGVRNVEAIAAQIKGGVTRGLRKLFEQGVVEVSTDERRPVAPEPVGRADEAT